MRLAIVAKGETYKFYPGKAGNERMKPYDEVWGLNQLASIIEMDRCYVMDDLLYRMPAYAGQDFCDWLKSYKGRIITSHAYPDWPTSENYPLEEVCKHYGLPLGVAMYSTPDYMIAQAVMDGWKEIDIFGVDQIDKGLDEMRGATAVWIGVALSRGIVVRTFPGSFHQFFTNTGICMEYGLYGYVFRPRIEKLLGP
jgi:hypothetical protein